jgi:hypothetical protein
MLTAAAFKALAARLLFPALLLNVTVANQQWTVGPFLISQLLFFWPAIASASILVVTTFGYRRLWPLLLPGLLLWTRAAGFNSAEGAAYFLYAVPLFSLFLLAGAVVALERPQRLYRQLVLYFIITVPFMLLQVGGAGAWTLALNTETMGVPAAQRAQARQTQPSLFVSTPDRPFPIGQRRPAGFMHSNNVLSFVIMIALAVQFRQVRSRRLTWTDVLFCSALVLSMAKIAVVGFLCMTAWLLLVGSRVVRTRTAKVAVLVILLYGAYAVLFPALFSRQTDPARITYSFFIRVNDYMSTLDPDSFLVRSFSDVLEDTPRQLGDSANRLSGYAQFGRLLPVAIGFMAVGAILLRRVFRVTRQRYGKPVDVAVLVLFVSLLFPAVTPIWNSPLYQFTLGMGLMPVVWFCLDSRRRAAVPVTRRPAPQRGPGPTSRMIRLARNRG